ncbi:MAG: V-type ATP synthase subunit F [Nitrososphaerota archaeon]|nr:V-type ATP synthase subunit F [Nitrososphaerota archaeon]
MRVAAVGDGFFISLWQMAGAEGFRAENDGEVLSTLMKLIKEGGYSVILLPERYVELTREVRLKLIKEGKIEPIFAFVPERGLTKRMGEIMEKAGLAIGVKLEV